MLQLADDRHLAEEAIDGRARGGRLGDDQLQRDELPGLVVPRLVDDPHRAPAQLAERGVVGHRLRKHRDLGAAVLAEPLDRLARRRAGGARHIDVGRRRRAAAGTADHRPVGTHRHRLGPALQPLARSASASLSATYEPSTRTWKML